MLLSNTDMSTSTNRRPRVTHRLQSESVVKFDRKQRRIRVDGKSAKGITKLLKSTFYPSYNYNKSLESSTKTTTATTATTTNGIAGVKKIKGSARVGRGFDTSVSQSVRLQQLYQLPFDVFFNKQRAEVVAKEKAMTPSHRKQLYTLVNPDKRIPYVQRFWQTMRKLQLRPVDTQVGVSHPTMKLATLIDVVCMDNKGSYRVIELKSGFETYYSKSNGKMNAPFEDQDNSPMNQHQLQLTATDAMFRHTFPTRSIGEPLIMRFDSNGVDVYPQRVPYRQRCESMFQSLATKHKL